MRDRPTECVGSFGRHGLRVFGRAGLVVALSVVPALFSQVTTQCPLTLISTDKVSAEGGVSPHGLFVYGSRAFELRGRTLATLDVSDFGDMQIAREDAIDSLSAADPSAAVAFSDGLLYVSGGPGLEIFDLRSVRAGGNAPILVSRTAGLHYERIAVSGDIFAGIVVPALGATCAPVSDHACANSLDFIDIGNPAAPLLVRSVSSAGIDDRFNDVAFAGRGLFAPGMVRTWSFVVEHPSSAVLAGSIPLPGAFVSTNGAKFGRWCAGPLLGPCTSPAYVVIGSNTQLSLLTFDANDPENLPLHLGAIYTLPHLTTGGDSIAFHPQVAFDEIAGVRMVAMIDQLDPERVFPTRTLAFDIFDLQAAVPSDPNRRSFETISYTNSDEIKSDPVATGRFLHVTATGGGLETWGGCDEVTGRIATDDFPKLTCSDVEVHGTVRSATTISVVDVLLDNLYIGTATLSAVTGEVGSPGAPLQTWSLRTNFGIVARGDHRLTAVAMDVNLKEHKFASQTVFLAGTTCTHRRRAGSKR
jgi:hypothetical protein